MWLLELVGGGHSLRLGEIGGVVRGLGWLVL